MDEAAGKEVGVLMRALRGDDGVLVPSACESFITTSGCELELVRTKRLQDVCDPAASNSGRERLDWIFPSATSFESCHSRITPPSFLVLPMVPYYGDCAVETRYCPVWLIDRIEFFASSVFDRVYTN